MSHVTRGLALAALATSCLVACENTAANGPETTAKQAEAVKSEPEANLAPTATDREHFGAPFTIDATEPYARVAAKADEYDNKTVRVSGEVSSVCKKKGCWFVLRDGEAEPVRITMKDYGFFVPKDCDGRKAEVEGVFSKKVIDEKTRKHFAEDQGEDPDKVVGDKVELTLVATAVEMPKAKE